jgi:uncharacterized protein
MARLGSLVSLVVLVWSFAAIAAAQSLERLPQPNVIVTSGEAEVKRAADRAWVSINAESRSKDPKEAQRLNTEAMTAVMAKLKGMALGADAIRTTSFELHPEFDYTDGRQRLRGYVARNAIEVRVDDVTRVGEVLTVAVTSGATRVGGLRFDLKDRQAAEREALQMAVRSARARAEAVAAGADVKIDRIIRIEDHRADTPEPPRPMTMRMGQSEAVTLDVPVTPGNLTIRASVTLTAAIR